MKYLFLILCYVLAIAAAQASLLPSEDCPTVAEIKNHQLRAWLPLYSASDTPASPQLIKKFEETAQDFFAAEWSVDYDYGHGRCYYNSDVEVSLAKEVAKPQSKNWHNAGNVDQCWAEVVSACPFIR